jgi:hypothetical protein
LVASLALPAWALSLILHLALVALLFTVVGTSGKNLQPTEEVEHELTIKLSQDASPPLFDPTPAPNPPAASAPPPALEVPSIVGRDAVEGPAAPLNPVVRPSGTAAADLDAALSVPQVRLPGPANAVETRFFGTPGRGAKFVYVIDRSASMNVALPLARTELIASLQLLPPTVEYQIVYYDLTPRLLEFEGKPGMLPATQENKTRTARLLDALRPEGGTDHIRALKRALTLNPQIIYFLTDADELKPQQVQELTQLNQRGSNSRIHCIELSAGPVPRGITPMQTLARDNRGEYRAVDVSSLPSR